MILRLTARAENGPESYEPLARHALREEIRLPESGDPAEIILRITADSDFSGVIRIALPLEKPDPSALFFLPGFMFGSNRGDAPLVTDSKTPRLRMDGGFPASPWWMVRSDRLSHPCALMILNGNLRGLSASPYYICRDGNRTAWRPGLSGDFDQYAGFGCSLADGEVW